MNDYLLAAVLGVLEGLTEFLPVSSTAHLRIAEFALGMDLSNGFWKMFSIVIQLGAILCLPIYFWRRLVEYLSTFPRGSTGDGNLLRHPLSLVAIAFVCTAVPAYLMTKLIGKHLEDIRLMAIALVVGGIFMIVVDAIYSVGDGIRLLTGRITKSVEDMRVWQAVWVGLWQVLSAVFPGTSRSMATIVPGQLAGMTRPVALEFSFLVSIPTMFMATIYDFYKTVKAGRETGATEALGVVHMSSHEWVVLAIGFVAAFIVAFVVVAWFMNWVRKRGFIPFGVYRIVLGAAVWYWLGR